MILQDYRTIELHEQPRWGSRAIWRRVAKNDSTSIEVHAFKKLDSGAKEAVEGRFSEYGKYAGLDVSVRCVRGKWIHQPSR